MNDRDEYFRMWIDLDSLYPFNNKGFLSYLETVWNTTTKAMNNVPGIETIIPDFGNVYALDEIDPVGPIKYFTDGLHDLIKPLEKKLGYTDGYDMRGAAYDWRYYHNQAYFDNLTRIIE